MHRLEQSDGRIPIDQIVSNRLYIRTFSLQNEDPRDAFDRVDVQMLCHKPCRRKGVHQYEYADESEDCKRE